MDKEFQVHRNKCHQCFKSTGRFILDCYCILCQACFSKRGRESEECGICRQKSKHNFIDVQDRSNVSRMSYLFSNLEFSFNRCIEAYKFQAGIDAKYCKFLENQLNKYKEAISEIVVFNPEFAAYFDSKLTSKNRPNHRSQSESLPNHHPNHYPYPYRPPEKRSNPQNTPRSMSGSSVMNQHERLVDPQRLGQRNYSGKPTYKIPNINYNTAMRSSRMRQSQLRGEEDDISYYRRPDR